MKKRTNNKLKGKERNLTKKNSNTILILFSIILFMLIISMIISFFTELSDKNLGVFGSYQGSLGTSGIFKINNPYPSGDIVSFFVGENRTFNVTNSDYQDIEWYLDGNNIKNSSRDIEIIGESPGNHTLEVRIVNGSQVDSKIWNIQIFDDSDKQIKFVFDTGSVIFWVILIILLIVIGLVVWLLIKESGKRKRRLKLDLKVIGEDQSTPELAKKGDISKRFNIPR